MRQFDYRKKWKKLLTPEIVFCLTKIHEFKGEHTLLVNTKADILSQFVETAKIQSVEYSNKMAGICMSDDRLRPLVKDATIPRTGNERKIAGYRDVMNIIYENYDYIPLKPVTILQLHRDLYKFEGFDNGGRYRNTDSVEKKVPDDGSLMLSFEFVPAREIPDAMEELCTAFDEALSEKLADPLILIPMFLQDFLHVTPFCEGNGRMSRILLALLLCRAGYQVGKYISIEKGMNDTREFYYECLQHRSRDWIEDQNDYEPFVKYLLGIIMDVCLDFSSRVKVIMNDGMSKSNRVRDAIKHTSGVISKAEILEKCPDVSQVTVQRTLANLVESGEILKIGGGRYTKYCWNND